METEEPSPWFHSEGRKRKETEEPSPCFHERNVGRLENKEAHRPKGKPIRIGKWKIEHWQAISALLIVYDYIAIVGAYFIALWIRFDGLFAGIPKAYLNPFYTFIFPFAALCIVIFHFFHLYRSMWRYASFTEMARSLLASLTTSVLHAIGITLICKRMPIAYYILGAILQAVFITGIRFAYRFLHIMRSKYTRSRTNEDASRVMLIGAGSAGQSILRDMTQAKEISDKVVCIIDDNPNKWNRYMEGVPVVGGRDDILYAAKKFVVYKFRSMKKALDFAQCGIRINQIGTIAASIKHQFRGFFLSDRLIAAP